jgi:hypothetical protein
MTLVPTVFPEAPTWPLVEVVAPEVEIIDYAALADMLVYHGEALDLDHSHLVMEDWLWAQHQRRLQHFYATGVYA